VCLRFTQSCTYQLSYFVPRTLLSGSLDFTSVYHHQTKCAKAYALVLTPSSVVCHVAQLSAIEVPYGVGKQVNAPPVQQEAVMYVVHLVSVHTLAVAPKNHDRTVPPNISQVLCTSTTSPSHTLLTPTGNEVGVALSWKKYDFVLYCIQSKVG
jgi:hypothetical protein